VIDRCQAQVDAVKAAKAVVDGIEKEIQTLRNIAEHQFPKGSNEDEIERIQKEKLAPAQAKLAKANTALQLCRSQPG
jgi:type II secretory pathway component PulM